MRGKWQCLTNHAGTKNIPYRLIISFFALSCQVAINWCICKGTVPIPGVKTIKQAEENLGALGWRLSSDELLQLEDAANESPRRMIQNIFQTRYTCNTKKANQIKRYGGCNHPSVLHDLAFITDKTSGGTFALGSKECIVYSMEVTGLYHLVSLKAESKQACPGKMTTDQSITAQQWLKLMQESMPVMPQRSFGQSRQIILLCC